MPLYFMLLDGPFLHGELAQALAASWRARSFEPCRRLCQALLPEAQAFAARYHTGSEPSLIALAAEGLTFDRHAWQALAGEILLTRAEIPEIETAPRSLCCLLAPEQLGRDDLPRDKLAPIRQVHEGSRTLCFGPRAYRPLATGYNNREDVRRLAEYLDAVDLKDYSAADLHLLPELAAEDRQEELELVREWFPALRLLYRQANQNVREIVCEWL
jgi:hypothetical protein